MPEYERPYPHLLDEIDRLRARLAEVEAKCEKALTTPGYNAHLPTFARRVLAAARGEGDRPAEPWPDEDAARFLDHERAQRSGEVRPAENWSAMCSASAPWQTANAFTLCRLPDGHDGDHERYGRTWIGEGDRA